MDLKIDYNSKYDKEAIHSVLKLLNRDLEIREISKITSVPETTIRNWKFGYSNLYGTNKKLNKKLKGEVINLLNKRYSIPKIAQKLKINYDTIRLFLKKELSDEVYKLIKVSDRKLQRESKILTPELSYILGVMYGDGYFGIGQIRLGTKDKDFMDYFVSIVEKWSKKNPSRMERRQHNKPYYECYLSFKDATEFVTSIIGNKKQIPKNVLYSNNSEIIMMFIKGFSDSEGTIITQKNGANYLKIYNQNKKILYQIKNLLLKLGFDEKKLYVVFNNKAKNGNIYAVRICYKDQLSLFYNKIGFTIQRKHIKLENCIKNK